MSASRFLIASVALVFVAACASRPDVPPERAAVLADIDTELEFHLLRGEIALQRNRLADAAAAYGEGARLTDNPEIARRATAIGFQAGVEDVALEAAERWLALEPDSADAHRYLGVLHLRRGNVDASAQHFAELVAGADDPGEAFEELLSILGGETRRRSAATVIARVAEGHDDELMAQFALARLSLRAARPRQALAAAERVYALRPEWVRAQLTLAQALLATGDEARALELGSAVAEAQPEDIGLRLEIAGLLMAAGLEDDARGHLDALSAAHPDDEDVIRALALVALQTGDLEAGREYWNRLRTGRRHRQEAWYYLGRIDAEEGRDMQAVRNLSRVTTGQHAVEAQLRVARLEQQRGRVDAALRHLEDFGRASPRYEEAMRGARARILVDEGRDFEALSVFDALLLERPGEESLLEGRAGVYAALAQREIEAGRYDDALDWYREGLAAHEDHPLLRYQRALLHVRLDRVNEAIREFERLLEASPDSPLYLNALGYTLADETHDYERAYELIERALEREPDNAAIVDSMGWVLYRLGDLDGALEYLQQAWSMLQDPEVAAHLVEVRLARGEDDEARDMLERALERWPDDRHLAPFRERLID